jgi:hypothetical protein
MTNSRVTTLSEAWIASSLKEVGDLVLFDECLDEPEIAWLAILKILQQDLNDEQTALLAAGPMEDLLSHHGPDFIERVETEARQNSKFNDLLGGVWKLDMTEDVWRRIQEASSSVW